MILRDYQQAAVTRGKEALGRFGDTLIVAPTGAGKTIMLSALVGAVAPHKALILQHREELVSQNARKFGQVNRGFSVSCVTASRKNWRGRAVFAMVQTLCRDANLGGMPRDIDLIVVDEAHHAVANSYVKILDYAKGLNPNVRVAGFTATPMRGDGRGLKSVFSNCADQIAIQDLIRWGHLTPPRAYVMELEGVEEGLARVRKLASDFDMLEVEQVMNKRVINQEVVRHWRQKAGARQTLVFCSTIQHAQDVEEAFRSSGVDVAAVTGQTPKGVRQGIVKAFRARKIQVVVNVAVLTEGFDVPEVGCVVLLRPCSYKSTMIQMIGRGLRLASCKKDCVVLDFGASLKTHGDICTQVDLDGAGNPPPAHTPLPMKTCPPQASPRLTCLFPDKNGRTGCGAQVPPAARECPLCGFVFQKFDEENPLQGVSLTEMDILERSPFRWVDLFGNGRVMLAAGFDAFVIVAQPGGKPGWRALGKPKHSKILENLGLFGRQQAMAVADDFLRLHETSRSAQKGALWMNMPPSDKQWNILRGLGYQDPRHFSRLTAAAHMLFKFNQRQIEKVLGVESGNNRPPGIPGRQS